jgi:short-subunit dehydrogenase
MLAGRVWLGVKKKNRIVFITGCRGGFGRDAALAMAKRGYRVIATTHTAEAAKELNGLARSLKLDMESFKLDVTSPKDRRRILDYDVDVLINNAGTGETGSLAEIDVNRVRHNFEVNVFGPLELTQLALKNMMKKDSGRVIFMSSLSGRMVNPFFAPYCMTKFSLSAGAEALRQELSRVTRNVHISVIEPGAYRTGFNQKMMARKYEWMDRSSYFWNIRNRIRSGEERFFNTLEIRSTKSVVDLIVKAAESDRPRLRYVAPWFEGAAVQLARMVGK